jgi:type I restriction enzyme S subunit
MGWIGDFPAHWKIKRLKYVANRAEVKVEADEDNPLPYVGLENIEPWTGRLIDLNDDLVPTGISNRFKAGDTLFGKLRPYLAKACNVDFDGLSSSELLVLRGKTYDRDFLVYQLLSHGFINLVDSSTYGSKMPRASWDFIGICELPQPPLDEQQAIARFLDAKTVQIDDLIAKKRQLIAKLKEKRSALIARTVTRGLPPEAAKAAGLEPHLEMKDSGVEWLGQIPSHWSAKAVRHIFRNCDRRRIPLSSEERADLEKLYPYYGASGVIDMVDDYLFDEPLILVAEDGANLLSRSTPLAFLATSKYWVNNHAHILKPFAGDIRYWVATLEIFDYSPLITGAAQPKLTADRLGGIRLPVPPAAEQVAISDYLEAKTTELDALISQAVEAISRLTEYRQVLITSAVTGKIDVRETPTLPEAA